MVVRTMTIVRSDGETEKTFEISSLASSLVWSILGCFRTQVELTLDRSSQYLPRKTAVDLSVAPITGISSVTICSGGGRSSVIG